MNREFVGGVFAYVVREDQLGEIGRIVVQGTPDGQTHLCFEVAGDPDDPTTKIRMQRFQPVCEVVSKAFSNRFPGGPTSIPPPPSPKSPSETLGVKYMNCLSCGADVALLVFADGVTEPGHFEDYARKMHHVYSRMKVPTWIVGEMLGPPGDDTPANVFKVWPSREPIKPMTPRQLNAILDQLESSHCPSKRAKGKL